MSALCTSASHAPPPTPTPIQISEQAAAILAIPSNAYWRPQAPDIRVDAIEFAEPSFLAGPFMERFGLVYIAHTPDAPSLQAQLDKVEAEVLDAASSTYLPYSAQRRISERYPKGVQFHYDRAMQRSYSDLDLPFLAADVLERLELELQLCGAFANTPAGRATLFKDVTPEEHAQHRQNLEAAVVRIHAEMRETTRCAERPYSVRLQGNDDASWTLTCATLDDIEALLEKLRTHGGAAVFKRMVFTN